MDHCEQERVFLDLPLTTRTTDLAFESSSKIIPSVVYLLRYLVRQP